MDIQLTKADGILTIHGFRDLAAMRAEAGFQKATDLGFVIYDQDSHAKPRTDNVCGPVFPGR